MLERTFELEKHATNVRTELLAGLTTFMTMAYIIFVNPAILADAGMDKGAVFVATCLAAAFGSAFMGLYANYPVALAPGMGLNAYFTYGVVKGMGHAWETALGAVFLSGVLFLIVSLTPIREWVINSIPQEPQAVDRRRHRPVPRHHRPAERRHRQGAPGDAGHAGRPEVADRGAGRARVHPDGRARYPPGAGRDPDRHPGCRDRRRAARPEQVQRHRLAAAFHRARASSSSTSSRRWRSASIAIVFTFFFVDVFDNTGTLVGVAHKAGLVNPDGTLPRVKRALTVDSTAAMVGAALGTSTTTSYIESAAGVNAGGRTGLVAVTVAVLFLAALFFAPLAGAIPAFATAPALVYVACLMMSAVTEIDFSDPSEFVPAVVVIVDHAADVLDRPRHRLRLHRLCRDQAAGRAPARHLARGRRAGRAVRGQVRAAVRRARRQAPSCDFDNDG